MKREVGVGRSIADVVVFVDLPQESRLKVQPLGTAECVVLARLRRGDLLTERELDGRTANVVAKLRSRSLVDVDRRGRVRSSDTTSDSGEVIAVEAKLRRWREALEQAKNYKRFADYSYVVLPAELAAAALQNTAEFEAAGIGLLLLERDRIVESVPAAKHSDHDWRREFVCSRLGGVRWFA